MVMLMLCLAGHVHNVGRDETDQAGYRTISTLLEDRSPNEIRKLQLDDPITGPVLRALEADTHLEPVTIARGGPEVRRLHQLWNRLLVEEGVLKRKYDNIGSETTQLVTPVGLRKEIMHELHSGALEGHLGEDKTVSKIRERFYWPGIQRDVAQYIRTCPVCATRKTPPQRKPCSLRNSGCWIPYAGCRCRHLRTLSRKHTGELIHSGGRRLFLRSGQRPMLYQIRKQLPSAKN